MSEPLLLIQTAFLGDLLLTIPLLKRLRKIRPQSKVHIVCRKGLGTVLKSLGLVDEIHEIQKNKGETYRKVSETLKTLKFEWVFVPHPSLRSALLARQMKAKKRIGFARVWNFLFYTHRVERVRAPEALRLIGLLSPLDRDFKKRWREWLQIPWNTKDEQGLLPSMPEELSMNMSVILHRAQPVLPVGPRTWAFFPGSVWATKQWPPDKFVELARKTIAAGDQVLWMGGPDEKTLCQELVEACPQSRSLAGQTDLWETLVVLSRCQGVVSNDSGGQHLAAVAGIPVLTVFGPTTLDFGFRPWAETAAIAEYEGLFCRPCGPHGNRKCPRGTLECQQDLMPARVEQVRLNLRSRSSLSR